MLVFKRRDTRTWAVALGGFAGLACMSFGLGTPYWWPALQIPLAAAVAGGIGGLIVWWRRRLPPDIDLHWLDPAEAARLVEAGAPPDRTVLYVEFERDWMRRYRLDVLVDGERVGQLPPGTGFLLTLQPGPHTVMAYLDRPRSAVTETVNSIPGGYAGFTVRNAGTRAIELSVRRDPASRLVLGKTVRLVRPAVPEA